MSETGGALLLHGRNPCLPSIPSPAGLSSLQALEVLSCLISKSTVTEGGQQVVWVLHRIIFAFLDPRGRFVYTQGTQNGAKVNAATVAELG